MNDIKVFDAHIHFNMKVNNILDDFKTQVKSLVGFILILNNKEEKTFFEKNLQSKFSDLFPNSVLAINYELIDQGFIDHSHENDILLGIKMHPRLSNLDIDSFDRVYETIREIEFDFLIIDCFYYGSNLKTHINLELAIYMAKHFKDKNILLAHGGGHKILDFMLYTREFKNIYYDLSLTSSYLQNTSVQLDIINFVKYNVDRVFFGSDYPDFTVSDSISAYQKIFNALDFQKDQKDKILFGNIINFLQKGSLENEK